jgi:hypothetical protein
MKWEKRHSREGGNPVISAIFENGYPIKQPGYDDTIQFWTDTN